MSSHRRASASLCKRDEVRAFDPERRAAKQIQASFRTETANRRVPTVVEKLAWAMFSPPPAYGRGSCRAECEPVRHVAVDLPVLHAIPGKEIVERDDAVERRPGKQEASGKHARPPIPKFGSFSPIEL